jgi:DMSO/TMAO reductase YedYZ molybdopterin-dependent catalytic subunit
MALFDGADRKALEQKMKSEGRLPPGQSLTLKWPVLHYGSVPRFDPEWWDFRVYGAVDAPVRWTWSEFNALPKAKRHSDFHCVTRWSRFDNDWEGVAFREVLERVKLKAGARYVLGACRAGIHRKCTFGRPRSGGGSPCHAPRWATVGSGAWLSAAADRAALVCLEVGEVGARD